MDGRSLILTWGVAWGRIRDASATFGAGPRDLKRIFLNTKRAIPGAYQVCWSGRRRPSSGRRNTRRRLSPAARARRACKPHRSLPQPAAAVVDGAGRQGTLREGDLVSGFHVILRPGHTSGHASLLRDEDGLLFTGDAFGAVALRRIRVGVTRSSAQTPTGKTLRGEAALGGVRHRGHEPRQAPAHRRPPRA